MGFFQRGTFALNLAAFSFVAVLWILSPIVTQPLYAQDLKQIFARHDSTSSVKIDHSSWQKLLDKYLKVTADGINRVDYAGFRAKGHKHLKRYLKKLQGVKVTGLNRREQYAYWVNLYNALTVDVILEHYPVKSIRDISISPGVFAKGPWGKKLVKVQGQSLSLDDIEHNILRKVWRDNRVHYAVNCASIGCPNLAAQAYTGQNLSKQLDNAAIAYLNHPRGLAFDGDRLTASKLFTWYAKDFGSQTDMFNHFRHYARPALAKKLKTTTRISGYVYDWGLNDIR